MGSVRFSYNRKPKAEEPFALGIRRFNTARLEISELRGNLGVRTKRPSNAGGLAPWVRIVGQILRLRFLRYSSQIHPRGAKSIGCLRSSVQASDHDTKVGALPGDETSRLDTRAWFRRRRRERHPEGIPFTRRLRRRGASDRRLGTVGARIPGSSSRFPRSPVPVGWHLDSRSSRVVTLDRDSSDSVRLETTPRLYHRIDPQILRLFKQPVHLPLHSSR